VSDSPDLPVRPSSAVLGIGTAVASGVAVAMINDALLDKVREARARAAEMAPQG
jgi:hypothetical protein